ncbi:MAG: class IV adenylate cyclase [Methanothrix sp.]|nr:class IV adenylate cyclase [Methanothrix sp.]
MIEVEVKARSPPDVEAKIAGLGGELMGVETHLDLYFKSPSRDFARTDEALRIRVKEEGARPTYKGPKLDSETKSRRELTVRVDDPEALEAILESVGFSRASVVKKRRTKYALGEAVLCVDEVQGLGSFIEVELSGDEDWADQKRTALEILAKLGLSESIRESYLELLNDSEARDG